MIYTMSGTLRTHWRHGVYRDLEEGLSLDDEAQSTSVQEVERWSVTIRFGSPTQLVNCFDILSKYM